MAIVMQQKAITDNIRMRLGIESLNAMQRAMQRQSSKHIVLLAPTGSGKTVGFALQLLRAVGNPSGHVQGVVIAPSRELVIQIAEVLRRIAVGLKVSALYGGHSVVEEKATLSVAPDIVVATPGRLLDHMQRDRIDLSRARALVLDEYDKSLELGFHDEMGRIVRKMRSLSLVVLTSATELVELPDFVDLGGAVTMDFRDIAAGDAAGPVDFRRVVSPSPDKLDTLAGLLRALAGERVIVFVNYRDAAERVYEAMRGLRLPVGLYHGGLDQIDRDKAIVRFNNGTTPQLIATDLGSRGLDIDNVHAVVHYHMPPTAETWTHRNGRTGRMGASGHVFVIESPKENVPDYVRTEGDYAPEAPQQPVQQAEMATLFFDAGKKDKISRGDIVGYLCQQGGIDAGLIGKIDLRDRCAYVAVPRLMLKPLLAALAGKKIKNTKVRISEAR